MLRYVLLTASIILFCVPHLPAVAQQSHTTSTAVNAVQSFDNLPVAFIPNRGQVVDTRGDRRPDILYTASSQNTQVFVRAGVISYVFQRRESNHAEAEPVDGAPHDHSADEASDLTQYRFDVELVGARHNVEVVEDGIAQGVRHYYLAHCPDGILNVPSFGQITLKEVYPKIDMVLRGDELGMKVDFVVRPGGNPSDIRMKYVGTSELTMTAEGGVIASTPFGQVIESAPVTFQTSSGSRRDVASHFRVDGNIVSFDIENYDRTRTLVIDPVRRWSTYYGAQNNETLIGGDVTEVDRGGNAIVTGYVDGNAFPTTTGAHQTTFGGSWDAFAVKFNGSGALQWATYYGGSGQDLAHGVVADTSLNVFIAGHTYSTNFPTQSPAQGTNAGGRDAFVVKFSKLGVRQWATYYGGTRLDDGYGFAADSAGNVAVLITSQSSGLHTAGMMSKPTSAAPAPGPPTWSDNFQLYDDVLIAKFSASGALQWATYFGGNDDDFAYAVGTDTAQSIIISGWTYSTNLPLLNAAQTTYGTGGDAFVAKYNKDGQRLWSTYYGGSGRENDDPAIGRLGFVGVATDLPGNVFIGGTTNGSFPVTAGAAQAVFGGTRDGYVIKFNSLGALQWATYFGGNGDDVGSGVAANPDGGVLLTGFTQSNNLPVTANCIACANQGMRDVYIARLSKDGVREFVDYYGGANNDEGHGISFDPYGSMVVAGVTWSLNFPILSAAQAFKGGNSTANPDAFVVLFCDPSKPRIDSSGPLRFCPGDSVVLQALEGYTNYLWNDLTQNATRTLVVKETGNYVLWARSVSGCEAYSDTIKVRVHVRIKPRLTPAGPIKLCLPDSVTLDPGPGYVSHEWLPGLETTRTLKVRAAGSYRVMTIDANGCRDTSDPVIVTAFPKPVTPTISPAGPITICEDDPLTLAAAGSASDSYRWSNNQTGQTMSPKVSGTYRVTVTGSGGCTNVSQDVQVTVNLKPKPTIYPSGPTTICEGDSVILSPNSSAYAGYRWSTGATTQNITVKQTGDYELAVTDDKGCIGKTTIHIEVVPRPQPRLTVMGPTTFCERDSVMLDAGDGYLTYQWSSGEQTRFIAARRSGEYWVSVTSGGNCPGTSDSVLVTVNPAPLLELTGPIVVCQNSTGQYGVVSGPNRKYTWSVTGNGASIASGAGTDKVVVQWGGTGSGSVRVNIEDETTGCTSDTTIAVTVGSTLVPSIVGKTRICPGESTTLDAGAGYASYAWSNGQTGRSISVSAAGTYTVDVTSAGGCSGRGTITITVAPTPAPVIQSTHAPSLCPGESMTLTVVGTFSGYQWSSGERSPTLVINRAGTYTVTVTDASGCTGVSQEFVVIANEVPRPLVDGPNSVCRNTQGTYTASGGAGDAYTWTVTGAGGTILSGQGTQSIVVQWGPTGNGVVDVSAVAQTTGCTGPGVPLSVSVTDNLAPAITPSGSTDLCFGESITLDAPGGYTSYAWSTGATSQSITVSSAGTYRVTVTGAGGCSGDGEITVTVRPLLQPGISLFGPQEFCEGDSTRIEGPAGMASYEWSTGETTPAIIIRETGTYSLKVTDDHGCEGVSTSIAITSHPLPPQPIITRIDDELESSVGTTYQWYLNGNIIPGATSRRYRPTSMGAHTVRITNEFNCLAFSEPAEGVGASAVISLPTITAAPGELVKIPITLKNSVNLDGVGAEQFAAILRFNRLLLFPSGTTEIGYVNGDERIIPITGIRPKGMTDGVLATLEFIAALGDTNFTVLQVDSLVWLDAPVTTTFESGMVLIKSQGGWQVYLPGGRLAISDPTPNPAMGRVAFAFEIIEPGMTDLALYDVLGRRVLDIMHKDLVAGSYPVELDSDPIAGGTYFIVLVTPTGRVVRPMQVAH